MVPEMTQEQIDALNRRDREYAVLPAPITDAEMAELDRLRAAARMPARLYAITRPREAWEGINVYEVDTGGDPHWFALCLTRERAEYTEAALNAYPALRARLDAAEREREELEAVVKSPEYRQMLADQAWIAARDARMKREGAAEWLTGYLSGLSAGNPGAPGSVVAILEEELKRLKEASNG